MTKYKKVITFSSTENMVVSIYVIGYKNEGESIVVLFKDKAYEDKNVVFSMVIDSYKTNNSFITEKILEKNRVENVNIVCWTHPHCDHSLGLDHIVDKYFNTDMVIFSPKFYYGNLDKDLLSNESKSTPDIFENIYNKAIKDPNYHEIFRTISAYGDCTVQYPILIKAGSFCKELTLYFLTPIGQRTDKYALSGNSFSSPNELSISFVMSLDGYDFFFGGDTEKENAKQIDSNIISDLRWIKVPHHCSLGAKSIVERKGPRLDFAASTVFTKQKLPVEAIQNAYIEYGSRLFMTQLKDVDLQHEYGVIRFDYNFLKDNIQVGIYTYGNAGEYFKE